MTRSFLVLPPAREVRGTVRVPPSKSATNRALLLAACSPEPILLIGTLDSDDTRALRRCLAAMGARLQETRVGLSVHGPLAGSLSRETLLDAGDSGTAARFLAAAAAAVPGRFRLDGSETLRRRPMAELIDALCAGGADVRCLGADGFLPLEIRGGGLRSGEITVDAGRSSQFVSALLIAAILVEGGLAVRPAGEIASSPYVDETLDALEAFGHRVGREPGVFRSARGEASPRSYAVPGDFSSAVPLLCAAGVAGGEVVLEGLTWPSRAPDAGALPVLQEMGLELRLEAGRVSARGRAEALAPAAVRATRFPDSVPALAALAARAPGESRLEGIAHLRWKESDRIGALAALLGRAGVECDAGEDSLTIRGGREGRPRAAALLPTFRDHRIVMAAALLSLARGGLLIEDPDCVAKSYPAFFRDLESLVRR